jgi:hypothetical protein
MHLYDTIKGENGRQFCETTLKMDPAEFDLDAVNRVEVFGTDIDDPGEDYCEFRGAGSNRAKNHYKPETLVQYGFTDRKFA